MSSPFDDHVAQLQKTRRIKAYREKVNAEEALYLEALGPNHRDIYRSLRATKSHLEIVHIINAEIKRARKARKLDADIKRAAERKAEMMQEKFKQQLLKHQRQRILR